MRRVRLGVLPADASPLRVLHFSDIHLVSKQNAKRDFLSALAGLEPDLVVSTGDNLGHRDAVAPLLNALGRLLEVPGAFVFGSNDYTAPRFSNPLGYLARDTSQHGVRADRESLPTEELRAGLASGGWQDVNERRATLEIRGCLLYTSRCV